MLRLEKEWSRPIEMLLLDGEAGEVASKLGITTQRVINWRAFLQLEWTKDALPSCKGCQWKVAACDPSVDTVQYPLVCRVLKLTKQVVLHELKIWEITH